MRRALPLLAVITLGFAGLAEAEATRTHVCDLRRRAPAPTVAPPATISVADMMRRRGALAMPYRHPSYVRRCNEESRRDTGPSTLIESKDDARSRATVLARAGRLDEVTIFARMIYGEAGTPQPGRNDNDAIVMLAVIDALRGSRSRVEMMVHFAPRRVFPSGLSEHQRWIAELEADGARPPSWPAPRGRRHHQYPAWRHYGCPRWLATVDQARELLQQYRDRRVGRGPCNEVPTSWGGEMDDHRMIRIGATRLQCGTMLNHPWRTPGMERGASGS